MAQSTAATCHSHFARQLRCPPSTEVVPLLSSTGSKSSRAFKDLHDGKTQLSSPSRKESYVESQQTGMPQQGDSLPHEPSGRPDSKNDSASNFP
ncbi:hypothetical protein HPB49_004571 [Dermacentor silvarum]|uniref:Uncharacterized protein n=1 Tax=Dermacentor silvarum TaxID=543639 RepID=A0ACB8DUV3_DERSI|nr:hypothetical protein HPB49_004571 [Dermacentor silvarum]